MLKYICIAIAIFTLSLHANEKAPENNQLTTSEQFIKCDKVYDDCSIQCENSTNTDDMKCYANCEAQYDLCLQDELTDIKGPALN